MNGPPNLCSNNQTDFSYSMMENELGSIAAGNDTNIVPAIPEIPEPLTEKTFRYMNNCAISVGNTPSGFATLLLHIKETPFFGIGTMFNLAALEITDAEIFYNSKRDFLLDEDIDPNSNSPLDTDRDRRMHKLSLYKLPETGEYRIDLVKMAKTGIPEIDALDPWKDFSDMEDHGAGNRQLELVKQFTNVLKQSRNEPDIIITAKIPENYPELEPCIGIVMFKRVQ